jgi:branched-chain amino acid transport system substrate-binding protein
MLADVEQATTIALLEGLKDQGVALKVPLFSIGYGGDLRNSGPAAEAAASGAYFFMPMEPLEMNTAATKAFAANMQKYDGVSQDQISLNQYLGYTSVVAFVQGLQAAGKNPTQAQFINAMLGIRSFNAAGLYGTHSVGFAMDQRGISSPGADNCTWVAKWTGSAFELVPGVEPFCGQNVPGKSA